MFKFWRLRLMPPTLTEDHLKTCLSKRSGKLDNSKEFNFACKLWCNLQKRSVTGIAEKDQTKISFLNKPSQRRKPIISSKPIQASQASQEWTHVVGCFWLQFSTFAAVCCCLLQIAACRFLLCDIVCCCLPLLLPLARFARNFNPNTMAKMSQKLENCSKMNLKWSWKWLRGAPWGPGEIPAGINCQKSHLFDTSLVHPGVTLGPQSESKSIPKRASGRNLREKRRFFCNSGCHCCF